MLDEKIGSESSTQITRISRTSPMSISRSAQTTAQESGLLSLPFLVLSGQGFEHGLATPLSLLSGLVGS